MKTKHIISYCHACECKMIICGTCGNNCCNGAYGKIGEKVCEDCPSAYEEQDILWKVDVKK